MMQRLGRITWVLAALCPALHAQENEAQSAADAILEITAPPKDDAQARVLHAVAVANKLRDPGLTLCVMTSASTSIHDLTDPEPVLRALREYRSDHGEVAHQAEALRHDIYERLGQRDKMAECLRGYATTFTVIGPFGDRGDHFTGVPFAPERAFPSPGEKLPGRYGPVTTRLVKRRADRYRVRLPDPAYDRTGCFYALHQVVAKQATPCYLRLWCGGSFEVWVNGELRARIDRTAREDGAPHFIPAVLRPGHNHVLVKTTSDRVPQFGLRYVDTRWFPLDGVQEYADAPKVLPPSVAAADVALPPEVPPRDRLLSQAAERATGEAQARLRIALALTAPGPIGAIDRLTPLWDKPPTDPQTRVALAAFLNNLRLLPESIRTDRVRSLTAGLEATLGDHATLFLLEVNRLIGEDRREEAIRRLRARLAGGEKGPNTFRALDRVYADLEFQAERVRLHEQWIQARPGDPEPLLLRARERRDAGDRAGALRLCRAATTRFAGHIAAQRLLFDLAADAGDRATATTALEALFPLRDRQLGFLIGQANVARGCGQAGETIELQARIAGHPHADARQVARAASELLAAGRTDQARQAFERVLQLDPSRIAARRTLSALAGKPEFAALAPFRVQAEDVIKTFKPGERERTAGATTLLDHMLVEVADDGSSVEEVHTVTRINDLSGVEAFEQAHGAGSADEVVLLRTIGADGRSYVPQRVQDEFSMPRLEPGAYVEEVYRNFRAAPGPNPQRLTKFFFQSDATPFLRSELVVVAPRGMRGTPRSRLLPKPPEVRELADGRVATIYRVDDAPRLPTEAWPPPKEDAVALVAIGEDGDDAATARNALVRARATTTVTALIERATRKLIADREGDTAKAAAIHTFVQQKIVDARAAPNPTGILLEGKGPRYLLEVAMLRAAGIPLRAGVCVASRPDLRGEAKPLYQGEVPYNVPCTQVRPRDGKPFWLFVDSPHHYPLDTIPAERSGGEVLLTEPTEASRLPEVDVPQGTGFAVRGELRLDPSGSARFAIEFTLRGRTGYFAADALRNQSANVRQRQARQILGGLLRGWSLQRAELVEVDRPGPLRVRGEFSRKRALERSGSSFLLPLPVSPSALLRRYGDRAERTLPLCLDREHAADWHITVVLGTGFTLTKVPEATKADHPLLVYRQSITRQEQKLSVERSLYQRPGRLTPGAFTAWRTLLQGIDNAENAHLELSAAK
ncbi:MAG: hypothetical protein H6836_06700 [Planctomycetes bacterium]|nr:hypothetical protein [Planctomycetota bacterium]